MTKAVEVSVRYCSDDPTTGELLRKKLGDLERYSQQISLAEDAKVRKKGLLIEIHGLYRQLEEEEGL